jgi:hypothetical protein
MAAITGGEEVSEVGDYRRGERWRLKEKRKMATTGRDE